MATLLNFLNSSIWISYLSLAVITPLLISTKNSELYELPKMLFVYFVAALILGLTLVKFSLIQKWSFPKNAATIALIIFTLVQVASSFTSIDKFTSIYGFPTRLNGGLLSQLAYLVIFVGALVNLTQAHAKKLLLTIIFGAFAVALWGIPSYFGWDPTCYVLIHELTSDCWQKEFNPQVRIFATLGQPNWLASYLLLALPISSIFFFLEKNINAKILFAITTIAILLAFILTNSRAGFVGLIITIAVFSALAGIKFFKKNLKATVLGGLAVLVIMAIFGTTLISRFSEIVKQTQNPTGGTESGSIRLIVWEGGTKIIKNWPILGSGPESFAYSYYLHRPLKHNQTTEWSFYYNKAHNELLNIWANTGTLGIASFLAFMSVAIFTLNKGAKKQNQQDLQITKTIIAGIIGYQTSIFFGFSVVPTQVVMFLLLASALLITDTAKIKSAKLALPKSAHVLFTGSIAVISLAIISLPIRLFFADLFVAKANIYQGQNISITNYVYASSTFPGKNPFYLIDHAYSQALFAREANDPLFAESSKNLIQKAVTLAPNNFIIVKRAINTHLALLDIDEQYSNDAQQLTLRLIELVPTDPQAYFIQARVLKASGKDSLAIESLNKALFLKPDYLEAKELLEQLTIDN